MINPLIFLIVINSESPKAIEGSLFNEYEYEYIIEALRRGGKGDKKRRRGGNGLR